MRRPARDPAPGPRVLGDGGWLVPAGEPGGHWIDHFAHFVTETLTTLWPGDRDVDGLVFHAFGPEHAVVAGWERTALDPSAFAPPDVRVPVEDYSAVLARLGLRD